MQKLVLLLGNSVRNFETETPGNVPRGKYQQSSEMESSKGILQI